MSTLKLHPHNLKQLAAIVSTFGECWIHGDGNMFVKKEHSDFRQEFSNPEQEESKYRAHFKEGDSLPTSVEGLERVMNRTRQTEKQIAKDKEKLTSPVTTVKVDGPEELKGSLGPSLEEIKIQALKEKELELQSKAQDHEDDLKSFHDHKEKSEKTLQDRVDQLNARALELEQREKDMAAKEAKASKPAAGK